MMKCIYDEVLQWPTGWAKKTGAVFIPGIFGGVAVVESQSG